MKKHVFSSHPENELDMILILIQINYFMFHIISILINL